MTSERQLGQLKRITAMRHRRSLTQLERASAERRVREADRDSAARAVDDQQQAKQQAEQWRAGAPACAQTRLWHQVSAQRLVDQCTILSEREDDLRSAEVAVDVARGDVIRADHRHTQVSKQHRKAVLRQEKNQDEKDAEDCPLPTQQVRP